MKIKYLIEDFEEDYEEKIVFALRHLYNELGYDGDACIQYSRNSDIIDGIKDVIDREQKSLDKYNDI